MLIDGEWVESSSGKWIEVDNPATGGHLDQVPEASLEDARHAIEAANEATELAKKIPAHERARLLLSIAGKLEDQANEFARSITLESGKPIRDSEVEVKRAIGVFTFAAEEAKRIYGEVYPSDAYEYPAGSENRLIFSIREPVGVVVAIGPFNFPLNLLAHKIAPALAAGNTLVVKPTSETPLTALRLGELIEKVGWPAGICNIVTGPGSTVGNELVENPGTHLITFTGSTQAGLQIAGRAAREGKKLILEMGGMDPFIILDDADLPRAADAALRGCFTYSGQICTASKRMLVMNNVADSFSNLLTEKVRKLRVGNPLERTTDVGPVINKDSVRRIHGIVNEAMSRGAVVLTGGRPVEEGELSKGSYYAPTVLDKVAYDMSVAQEEPFAPVAPIIRFSTYDEAVKIANSTIYGLQASICTTNIGRALRMAREIRAGAILIDDPTNLRWDNAPFGGVKKSGLGREGVRYAIQEMTETKLIDINLSEVR